MDKDFISHQIAPSSKLSETAIDSSYPDMEHQAFHEPHLSFYDKNHQGANAYLQKIKYEKHLLQIEQMKRSPKNVSPDQTLKEVLNGSPELLSQSSSHHFYYDSEKKQYVLANYRGSTSIKRRIRHRVANLVILRRSLRRYWHIIEATFAVVLSILRGLDPQTIRPCSKKEVNLAKLMAWIWRRK